MTVTQHQMHVPLEKLQTPRSGECVCEAFWMVHPEKGALYVLDENRAYAQGTVIACYNYDERVVARFLQEGHVALKIPVAYLSQAAAAQEEFRKEVQTIVAGKKAARRSPDIPFNGYPVLVG